jgi:type VI protein secretion system component VasK
MKWPFVFMLIAVVGVSGLLVWVGALIDVAQYDPATFVAVNRTKRGTLTLVALTWAFGGLYYWLRLKQPLKAADDRRAPA